MTMPQPPAGQGPIDPRGAFAPPGAPPFGGPPPGPPPMMMPPPMGFYPPPPHRGGFVRAIFMTLATSIFGLSIAANIYLLILTGFLGGGTESRHQVVVKGDPKQKIVALQVSGILDEQSMARFEKVLRRLEDDADLKALVLEIDSPGGSVNASDQMYARVLKFKQDRKVPVVVSMGGVAASGGYYIACAADKIVAQRTTITGSIGVLMPRYDLSKLAERWGVEDNSMHSTGATYKTAGSWLKPETAEEHQYFLSVLDDMFATFKEVVRAGRGKNLKRSIDEVANGKIYTASEALEAGLIDQIGYPNDAYDLAGSIAGLTDKHVVRFEPAPSLLEALGAESSAAKPIGSSGVHVTGVNLNVDKSWLYELMSTRPMYLWRE